MNVTLTSEEIEITREFNLLLATCTRCSKKSDKVLLNKAFKLALEAHKDMRRKSGELYILHPLAVARIVNHEMGLGVNSMICALLHDVVEDTDYTIEEIENMFGPKIASIINGLTKISGVFDNRTSQQAENFRKILLTLADDIRVILIKIADRLHNMRTLSSLPLHKQMKIASETIYLYAPLAHRLGLYAIKTELEDLSLKYRFPKVFEELETKLKQNSERRKEFLEEFRVPIEARLKEYGINYEINAREKSIYSIWQKMQKKNVPFEEIYDLMAIRIIFDPIEKVPEKTQCWNIYSLVTDIYMPKPERIRDWVSTPKANGYEALHATVMGPKGHWVEVQIRSRRMDEIAEKGFAAHWKYKQDKVYEAELDKWIKRITDLLEDPNADALEFLDDLKLNLFTSEIFIFTPKGDIKGMPTDATALDFAYEVHSEIGHKAIGAKINHKLVGLNTILKSGDQVEVITSDKAQPRIDWLNKVKTGKARAAIKHYLKGETKNRIEKGKQLLEEKLKELKLVPSNRVFRKILPNYNVTSKDELYSKLGIGIIELDNLEKILKKNTKNKWIKYWSLQFGVKSKKNEQPADKIINNNQPVLLRENLLESEPEYLVSKCCNPIPGDDVIGVRDEYDQTVIHKTNCAEAIRISSGHGERLVKVQWTTHKFYSFLVKIAISGIDRFGVYNDITTVITKQLNVNIRNINLQSHDGIWEGTIELYVHNTKDLNLLIMNLVKIKGVESVNRVESSVSQF
jgi:GTP diphosphokinase / guanosine-3',5'-bis(diphosphate) 3'-diphosphatase